MSDQKAGALIVPTKELITPADRKEYLLKGKLIQGGVELQPGEKALLTERQADALRKASVID